MSRHHRAPGFGSRRWARVRRLVLDAAGWRCKSCGRAGRLEVDHLTPISRGGDPFAIDNLQALCRCCHVAKTIAENRKPLAPEVLAWKRLVDELS